jgi:hypothetical protein
MTCKIDHTEEGALPLFLCRACNPHLNRTRTQLQELEAAEIAARHTADAARAQAREVLRLHSEIDRLRSRGAEPDSVAGKILTSLERKLATLEGVL